MFGLKPAQLLSRLKILSSNEGDWLAFGLATYYNGTIAMNYKITEVYMNWNQLASENIQETKLVDSVLSFSFFLMM